MPNGGTLHVSCDNLLYGPETIPQIVDLQAGDYIRISIRDEGGGIPEDLLKRIFDPYFTTKAKGNGLGLATTYSIVKNHNGLITVDSQVHVGTTFTLYLPASRHQFVAAEPPRVISPVVTGTGLVLIVVDEEAIRALVEFTLSRLGYEVSEAETAMEGVNLYREKMEAGERFDVVILDLTLPGGMGGKEALKQLIELDPTVNAIVPAATRWIQPWLAIGIRFPRRNREALRGLRVGRKVNCLRRDSAGRINLTEDYDGGRLPQRVA
jgi:CheY-like chemotaxis protein